MFENFCDFALRIADSEGQDNRLDWRVKEASGNEEVLNEAYLAAYRETLFGREKLAEATEPFLAATAFGREFFSEVMTRVKDSVDASVSR